MKFLAYLGVVIFIYILSTLNFNTFFTNIKEINILFLIIAFLLNFPMIYFKSFRWKEILSKQQSHISANQSFQYYMSSLYLGFITPGRVGEFSRVIYIKKQEVQKSYGSIFSSIILDRLFDLYLLVVLTLLGFVFLSMDIQTNYMLLFVGLFFLLPYIFIKFKIFNKLLNVIAKKSSSKFHEKVSTFVDDFVESIKKLLSFKNISYFFTLTALSYVIFFTQTYLIALSIGIQIDFITLTFVMAISNTISLLPISISGIGTRDVALLYFLSPLGFTSESIVLYSTLVLIIFFAGCASIGFFYFLRNGINLQDLKVPKQD